MSTLVPGSVHPYPPHPGQPSGVDTFYPGHPYTVPSQSGPFGNHATLGDDLVSYWPLSADGTDSVVASGNDLTNNNAVTFVPRGPSGVVAQFTQANTEQLTHADNAGLSLAGAKTWVAWVRPDNTATTRPVFAKRDAGSVEYQLLVDASNTLGGFVQDSVAGSSSFGGSANASIPVGAWKFCVWWYDPADKKIHGHVNLGIEQLGSALANGPIDGTQTFSIGESANAFWYGGNIARAGIWDRVVSLADLTTLFNSGSGKSYADLTDDEKVGLVSYWNLDEASGNRADSHGSNTLTDNNTVTSVTNAPANIPATVANFVAASLQQLTRVNNTSFNFAGGGFTFAGWVNAVSGDISFSKDDLGPQRAFNRVGNSWYVFQTDAISSQAVAAIPSIGSWHFFVAWFDDADGRAKIQWNNGAIAQGAVITGVQDQTSPFALGQGAGVYTNGTMSSVVMWSRVLTAQERTDLYNAGDGLFY